MAELSFCFVFARGGSKGLPGKNHLNINDIPLIGRSIQVAQKIPSISNIFLSTDCEEIASVGLHFGADIIKRPAELATDNASEWTAWKHAVTYVQSHVGQFHRFISLPALHPAGEFKMLNRVCHCRVTLISL